MLNALCFIHTAVVLYVTCYIAGAVVLMQAPLYERGLCVPGVVLAWALVLTSNTKHRGNPPAKHALWLTYALWAGFFLWFGWFSSLAPFQMHEVHSVRGFGQGHGFPDVSMAYKRHLAVMVPLWLVVLFVTAGIPALIHGSVDHVRTLTTRRTVSSTLLIAGAFVLFAFAVGVAAGEGVGPITPVTIAAWCVLVAWPTLRGDRVALIVGLVQSTSFPFVLYLVQRITR